jgi:signal transduction histidine kinase/DNA-binding response OmpR family regulator
MGHGPPKRTISVAAQLYGATALCVLAVATLAGSAVHFSNVTDEAAQRLSVDAFSGIEASARFQMLLDKHRRIVESAPSELDASRLDNALRSLDGVDQQIRDLARERAESRSGPAADELTQSIARKLPALTDSGRKVIALAANSARDRALASARGGYDSLAEEVQKELSNDRRERIATADRSVSGLVSGARALLLWVSLATALALLLVAALAILVTRGVLSRLVRIKESMILLARDDTSAVVPCVRDLDEVGDMARAVEVFKANAIELLERKKEIEAVNERFDAALKNMPHGLCMYDADDRLVVINQRFREIYRMPERTLMPGLSFREVLRVSKSVGNFPDRDSDEVWAERKAFIDARRRGEFLQALPGGRTILISHVPLATGGWLATYEDITERQRAEAELISAKQKAELADRAKTEFLATMSHEIRTPLNGILGYADLLLEQSDLRGEQRRQLRSIQTAGSMLLTVVNDILDFSKIEAGQITLENQPFSLLGLIDSTASVVQSSADQKRLALRIEARGPVPDCVLGDEDRLRQVLLNLLNNAVKFTPAGTITLSLEGHAAGPGEWLARFAVADTGIGIPDDKRVRLFERFSQVDSSIRREFGGTGLGLAISKQLVELMGGSIGVESEVGRGSTFWFTVRLREAESRFEAPKAGEIAEAPRHSALILLVDDNEINREVAQIVLEGGGYRVDGVVDGADAIAAVQAKAYDLVLMDIQMPGVDGITATQRIRALDHPASRVPIVAMTANVLPQHVEEFRRAGMNDHVGKPFKKERLLAVIEACLSGRDAQAIPPAPAEGFDGATFADVLDVMGREQTNRLLDRLVGQLEQCLRDPETAASDRQRLGREVHALVSAAGLLGFSDLSEASRALERACHGEGDLARALGRFQISRQQALEQIPALKSAA